MNTKGVQGDIHETAVVYTNDPNADQIALGVRAFVQVPVFISPRYVFLQGSSAHAVSRTVKIEAELEKPLFMEPDKFNLDGKVRCEITEIEKGRAYSIRFTSIPGNPGRFVVYLNLKTNYEEMPVINIGIRGTFQ